MTEDTSILTVMSLTVWQSQIYIVIFWIATESSSHCIFRTYLEPEIKQITWLKKMT